MSRSHSAMGSKRPLLRLTVRAVDRMYVLRRVLTGIYDGVDALLDERTGAGNAEPGLDRRGVEKCGDDNTEGLHDVGNLE